MLDEMEPRHFRGWLAFDAKEPVGHEWTRNAILAAVTHNGAVLNRYCQSGDRKALKDLRDPEDFLPGRRRQRKARTGSPELFAKMAAKMYGKKA